MKQAAGRIARIIIIGLVGTIGVVVLLLVPDLFRLIHGLMPYWLRLWWVEVSTFILLVVYFTIRWFAETEARAGRVATLARLALQRVDFVVEWAWSGGLGLTVSLLCIVFLIGWVPHYLTWPFSRDEDTFAVLAMSWSRGILPYRDIKAYNFPGEIYVLWVLGKLFGWGAPSHSMPLMRAASSCWERPSGLEQKATGWSAARIDCLSGLLGRVPEYDVRYYGRARLAHGALGLPRHHGRSSLARQIVEDRVGHCDCSGAGDQATRDPLSARAGSGCRGAWADFGAGARQDAPSRGGVVLLAEHFLGDGLRSGGVGRDRR
jgi:hypothetical protein